MRRASNVGEGTGVLLPKWVLAKTNRMCAEGAESYVAWYVASLPFHRKEVEHLLLYEEAKQQTRSSLIQQLNIARLVRRQ